MKPATITPRRVAALNALLVLCLVAAVIFIARDAIRFLYGKPEGTAKQEGVAAPQEQRPAALPLKHFEPVLKENVFGFPPGELVPLSAGAPGGDSAPPQSTLDITLAGTVAWADGFGYAVVSGKEGHELYRAGDFIPGAGRLEKVMADRIVIDSGGRKVEVELAEKPDLQMQGQPSAALPPGGDFARMTAKGTYVVDRQAVDESLGDPKRMLTDARLLPNLVDGQQMGFVMSEVRDGGLYHSLGLRNGDVLLRVNDFDISSAESGLQAFTALRGMDRIELDVLRDGQPLTLTYIIR